MADRTQLVIEKLPVFMANKAHLPEDYTIEQFKKDLHDVFVTGSGAICPEHDTIIDAFGWLGTKKGQKFWNDLHVYTCASRGIDELWGDPL